MLLDHKLCRHHEIFYRFPRWSGWAEASWNVNFLGVKTRTSFFRIFAPELVDRHEDPIPYPKFDEEYFEWIDLLEAVTAAEGHFTIVELGAGWGRWMANSVAALKLANPLPYTLVGVEAEPTHFQWTRQHLEDNGVDLGRCQLIEAAVTDKDGTVGFFTGETPWGGPYECYGQAIGGPTEVKAISLNTILRPLSKVDLIDIDVQGAELDVLTAAREELDAKVKRIHIETHNREVEDGLRQLFGGLGWKKIYDYPCCLDYPGYLYHDTEWGVIPFQGGVQTWVNPRLASPEALEDLAAQRVSTAFGFHLLVQPGDFTSELIWKNRIYEAPESELITRLVRPGDVCVDAGCHLGYYTCLLADLVGPTGRVLAFDANPWCCKRTQRNLRANLVQSADVIHAALGDRAQATTFNISTDDQIGLSSLGPIETRKQAIEVPMVRLEDVLAQQGIERVRLLKLDVEGAEALVLQGFGRFLKEHRVDFILLELNDERLQLLDTSADKVASLLQAEGYVAWEYDVEQWGTWSRVSEVRSRQDCNILFASPSVQDEPQLSRRGMAQAAVWSGQRLEKVEVALSQARDEVKQLRAQIEQLQNEVVSLKRVLEGTREASQRSGGKTSLTTPAQALWNQRERIKGLRQRILDLSAAVNQPTDLTRYQWAQIMAFTLDFAPDLIIELGRGMGNSTCVFLEVANQLGGASASHVTSLCLSNSWFTATLPRLRKVTTPEWLAPGEILQVNILDYDFAPAIQKAQRVLVFWDAHGFEVAECVLARLLPLLARKEHRVLMHDMSDVRYEIPKREYGDVGIWRGENASDPAFWLGHIFSRVAQAISIVDFSTRNNLPLHSAVESYHEEFAADPQRLESLRALLGDDFFALQSHWFWFSLNELTQEPVFPPFKGGRETPAGEVAAAASFEQELTQREDDVEWLMENLRNLEEQVRILRAQKREWEATWQEVQNSAGWRLLERWRRLRDRMAPKGSARRRLYDSMIGSGGR